MTYEKLLVVCGPTATGKTRLALSLANMFNGELVSADSRQVYKFMNIGTGKDIPDNFQFSNFNFEDKSSVGCYEYKNIRIWGYDLAEPCDEFSVSQYVNFANKVISNILSRKRLPILVGGTGFYISGVVDGFGTVNIPRNLKIRNALYKLPVSKLQEKLKEIDINKFSSLNNSDIKNPRRLTRAIEVALSGEKREHKKIRKYDVLFIGLFLDRDKLRKRITKRIEDRIKNGFEKEIEFLKQKNFFNCVPLTTLGYKNWPDVEKWKIEEYKYARRQMTWFKKDKRIIWFDVSEKGCLKKIEKMVKRWYSSSNN